MSKHLSRFVALFAVVAAAVYSTAIVTPAGKDLVANHPTVGLYVASFVAVVVAGWRAYSDTVSKPKS